MNYVRAHILPSYSITLELAVTRGAKVLGLVEKDSQLAVATLEPINPDGYDRIRFQIVREGEYVHPGATFVGHSGEFYVFQV